MAMMEDNATMQGGAGMGMWGLVIFFILLFWIFNDKNRNGNDNGRGADVLYANGCGKVSNCEVEKQTIINTATTNFLIEQRASDARALTLAEGNATRMAIVTDGNATRTKIDFYAYEDLKDRLAQERSKTSSLESMIYSDRKFNTIESQLASIACNTPQRPPFYGQGFVPCGQPIPNGNCGM